MKLYRQPLLLAAAVLLVLLSISIVAIKLFFIVLGGLVSGD